LSEAVWDGRAVELRYERRGKVVRRRVDPLGLVLKGAAWYLVAAAQRPAGLRSFRVDRVRSVQPLDRPVVRPESFDLATAWAELQADFEQHVRNYPVVARMARADLWWLRHGLPEPSASRALAAAEVAEGDPVTFAIESESLHVASGELLRLGGRVEVLEPSELRATMRETGEAMAALHS
jgi:predicted DNA-binding transcriptional regulator YafY